MAECSLVLLLMLVTFLSFHGGAVSSSISPLPTEERMALNNFISNLGLVQQIIVSASYCHQKPNRNINISCYCNNTVCHINSIVGNSGMSGVIHKDVTKLRYLEELNLAYNQLHGSLPSNLGVLSNLKTLDLSDNKLSGNIPKSLGNLKNLISLDLSNNQLNGDIPKSLGSLKNLTSLKLQFNLLTGKIPGTLGQLSALKELILWCNKLKGEIPLGLGSLSQLELLDLGDNQLFGELPPELGKLSNLQEVWLNANNFSGNMPEEYAQLRSIELFAVGGNGLSGQIPSFFANWANLSNLNLIGNNFDGELPLGIFNLTSLNDLWVSDLKNPGFTFPASANLKSLESLILRNCSINGQIPKYIGNWTGLRHLDLSFNRLTGNVPDSFRHLNLSDLFLNKNELNGTIPPWINDVVKEKADLSYNNFTSETSSDSRKIIIEPNDAFIHQMVKEHCHGQTSKHHSLFINAGAGKITHKKHHYEADTSTSNFYISPAKNWAYSCSANFVPASWNSSNYLRNSTCGVSFPEAPFYETARFCPQSLIYYGFCLQKGHYTVKLDFAETEYTKDEDYSSNGNRVFDIYIQGKQVSKDFNIKEKVVVANEFTAQKFPATVTDNLLVIHLFWAGKGSIGNPPYLSGPIISAIAVTRVGGLSRTQIAGITVASIFTALLLLALMWRLCWLRNKKLQEMRVELRGKSYAVKQVIDATRNFSPKMEIGKDRFGISYKAELPDQIVAVKKLSPQSKEAINQIQNEVYTLKTVKHSNLVELLDGYSKKGLHMLIYEYTEHRSLAQVLFDSNSSLVLNWDTRFNICLGIAKGLKYLHEDSRIKIVHRNIEAANILLDKDLNAKISEFGFAMFYEEENPYAAIGAGRTLVYMAPEYATRKVITDKADVYSVGVVLLEIVSGKSNADYKANQETIFLIDTACVLHKKGKLMDLIDEKLTTYDREQAIIILKIAMMSIDQSPTLRPKMSEIVSVLEGHKKIEEISKASTSSGV